jgi:hypothetical protein
MKMEYPITRQTNMNVVKEWNIGETIELMYI